MTYSAVHRAPASRDRLSDVKREILQYRKRKRSFLGAGASSAGGFLIDGSRFPALACYTMAFVDNNAWLFVATVYTHNTTATIFSGKDEEKALSSDKTKMYLGVQCTSIVCEELVIAFVIIIITIIIVVIVTKDTSQR